MASGEEAALFCVCVQINTRCGAVVGAGSASPGSGLGASLSSYAPISPTGKPSPASPLRGRTQAGPRPLWRSGAHAEFSVVKERSGLFPSVP